MLIHSASQLLTLKGGPQRGTQLGSLGILSDGALLIDEGKIAAVGTTADLRASYPDVPVVNAENCVVMPGFVDPHTHLIWAGDRAAEFEQRLEGESYLEILAAGGGILSTVQATREATLEQLLAAARPRLNAMLTHGTTTAEAKTGYGLNVESELRLLEALLILGEEGPLDLAITFLGAHAIPRKYQDDPQGYTDHLCAEMIPAVKDMWPSNRPLPFVDVFCERGAFDLQQSRQILTLAKELGFPLKIHADEFDNLGGAAMAAALGAVSADHLVTTSAQDIEAVARSDTVAVALPNTPFGLAEGKYTPARQLLEAGAILALATDLNPGTAWCENMQFAIALACRYMRLTPAQAIAAATINAAAAIDRSDKIGSLEPGKKGDAIILNVSDYRHLGYRFGTNLVKTVIKAGEVVVQL